MNGRKCSLAPGRVLKKLREARSPEGREEGGKERSGRQMKKAPRSLLVEMLKAFIVDGVSSRGGGREGWSSRESA